LRNASKAGLAAFSLETRFCAPCGQTTSDARYRCTHLGERIVARVLRVGLRPVGGGGDDDVADRLYDGTLLALSMLQGVGEGAGVLANLECV
jgi:hypothetical protein